MGYLKTLFKYEWELVKSPAGAYQWLAKDVDEEDLVVDAHDPNKKHRPMMTTADLGLRYDPIYSPIARNYLKNPEKFEHDFAVAWFKLTHRDMGPISRYLGPEVPNEVFIWQDPVPKRDYKLIDNRDIAKLKKKICESGLSISDLISTAWKSASTFRISDKRGGANGARLSLLPQREWEVNEPEKLNSVLCIFKDIKDKFNNSSHSKKKKVSLADLIVLGGCSAIERAAEKWGYKIDVPFIPGRTDALQNQTDIESFDVLEPKADGFRNYVNYNKYKHEMPLAYMLIDRAQLLTLTAPEMTVLLGGMRVLDVNYKNSKDGVLTSRPQCLTNDFFVNLLDMNTEWKKMPEDNNRFHGIDRKNGKVKWTATAVDLTFGSNSQLRAIAEVYACDDNKEKFLHDFICAWNKVMNADRFDIK